MVSNEEFAKRVHQGLKEQMEAYISAIADNSPKNIEEYRYKAGLIGGLALAARVLEETLGAYMEANDE